MPQLTYNQRKQLQSMLVQQLSQAEMGRRLGVHRSTVKRELERNSWDGEYEAVSAEGIKRTRKRDAGYYNQQRRLNYEEEEAQLVRRAALFRIAMKKRETKPFRLRYSRINLYRIRVYKLEYRFPRLRLTRYYEDIRGYRDRPKRFYQCMELSYKQWYNRTYRLRDHIRENITRMPRSSWEMSMYRRPEIRLSKYRPLSLTRLKRLLRLAPNPLPVCIENETPQENKKITESEAHNSHLKRSIHPTDIENLFLFIVLPSAYRFHPTKSPAKVYCRGGPFTLSLSKLLFRQTFTLIADVFQLQFI